MTETLLKPNRRFLAFLLGMISLVFVVALTGVVVQLAGARPSTGQRRILLVMEWLVVGGCLPAWIALVFQIRRPRLAYRAGELVLNVGMFRQLAVPIQYVECFFLGRAAAKLPGSGHLNPRVATVVVRLSESAADYADRDLPRGSGKWKDSYITIYGTWCEPLSVERVNRLNAQFRQSSSGQLPAEP